MRVIALTLLLAMLTLVTRQADGQPYWPLTTVDESSFGQDARSPGAHPQAEYPQPLYSQAAYPRVAHASPAISSQPIPLAQPSSLSQSTAYASSQTQPSTFSHQPMPTHQSQPATFPQQSTFSQQSIYQQGQPASWQAVDPIQAQPSTFSTGTGVLQNCSEQACGQIPSLCNPMAHFRRNWFDVEYLLLFSDGFRVPELVAESAPGTPRPQVGLLDDPATNILLGNERLGDGAMSGLRLGFGRWLDPCGNLAFSGSVFWTGSSSSVDYPSDPDAIISRPFFNTAPTVSGFDSELVNFAGAVDGTISVATDTDIFSANMGLRKKLRCCEDPCDPYSSCRIDLLYGSRIFSINEELTITEALTSTATSGFVANGTQFDVMDRFATRNRFHGVEIGLLGQWQRQRWTFGAMGKAAFGVVRQRVNIDGSTTITVPGIAPVTQPWGILATPTNIGEYKRNRFGVLTEANLEVGYYVSCRCKLKMGYTLLALSDVVRPGDAIDLNVNSTYIDPLVPDDGPETPEFQWESGTAFLHGLNFGLEFYF